MKRARRILIAFATVLTLTTPAGAERRGSPREVYDAGQCIVARDRGAAVELIRSLPISADVADLTRLPPRAARRCFNGLTEADALHLRGAIAQALFFRDFGGMGLEPRRSASLVDLALPVEGSTAGGRITELYRWADCVVRNDGERVDRLLASVVGSRSEAGIIGDMRDFMAACAPAGAQFSLRPSELRSIVAQSAYHTMFRYWTRELRPVGF